MLALHKAPRLAGLLGVALTVAPLGQVRAATPQPSANSDESTQRFVEPPPEPEPRSDEAQPLRIVSDEPAPITLVEPPAPELAVAPEPAPALRIVDSRRPMPGSGLIALGAVGLGASAIMVITALAGPGWGDLEKRDAAIVGGLSLPVTLASMGMVIGGTKAHRKYDSWAERNSVSPPAPGNGIIVGGAAVTLAGVVGIGAGTQFAITDPTPSRGNWAIVAASGAITAVGLAILANGMVTRSKFAAWERGAYLTPGTMALKGGAGLSLSGRF